jgi:hypothetical protein
MTHNKLKIGDYLPELNYELNISGKIYVKQQIMQGSTSSNLPRTVFALNIL